MTQAPTFVPALQLAACPICSGTRLYYVFSAGENRVARCNDCGLLAASAPDTGPMGGGDQGAAWIDVATIDVETTGASRVWDAATMIAWLDQYRGSQGGTLLLVGPGEPAFLQASARAGYRVTLVEGSGAARERANAVISGTDAAQHAHVSELRSNPAAFDVAVLDGALNNTRAPGALLQEIHRLLKPDGVILATAPSISLSARRTSGIQATISMQAGCFAFESRTLQSMLFKNSFREIVELPPTRGRRGPRENLASAVLARPIAHRPRPLLSVVVPAFNEAGTVASTLDRLIAKRVPGVDIEIVVVESNSSDGTREIIRGYEGKDNVRLVFEDRPRGKGHAVRTGLEQARGDFVLIQDADLEYDLEDYDVLLEPLLTGREAFILGARHGGQTWKIRKFNDQPAQALILNLAHAVFTSMINVSLGLALKDPFTMYKVFRRDCLHGLHFECNRFDFDWELLIKLVRKGYVPTEIPVNYRSRSFKEGKKVSMFRDPVTWVIALIRSLSSPIDLLRSSAPERK